MLLLNPFGQFIQGKRGAACGEIAGYLSPMR